MRKTFLLKVVNFLYVANLLQRQRGHIVRLFTFFSPI